MATACCQGSGPGDGCIAGMDRVQSGVTYHFYCSLHPGMQGQLIVQ